MQPITPKRGQRITLLIILALVALLLAGPALMKYTQLLGLPVAGNFNLGVLEVPVLGAFQFFAAVSVAFVAWRVLFPGLYAYVRDCMEGKLMENLTDDLRAFLGEEGANIMLAAEKRHIAQFQFIIRCTRFVLALFPFACFLVLAVHAVNTVLTVVPH